MKPQKHKLQVVPPNGSIRKSDVLRSNGEKMCRNRTIDQFDTFVAGAVLTEQEVIKIICLWCSHRCDCVEDVCWNDCTLYNDAVKAIVTAQKKKLEVDSEQDCT